MFVASLKLTPSALKWAFPQSTFLFSDSRLLSRSSVLFVSRTKYNLIPSIISSCNAMRWETFKQVGYPLYRLKLVFELGIKFQFHLQSFFFCSGNDFFEPGGRKFSPVTTFLPVFASSSRLAFLAIPPPFLPASLFSSMPVAFTLSAI